MTKKIINLGTADKGNGDPLRVAFGKVNDNFTELYNAVDLSAVAQDIIPATTETYDLGSPTHRWGSLYVSANTIFIGEKELSINANGGVEVDGVVVATPGGTQANADWNATAGIAQILNKPTIPSLTGYATETFVTTRGYLTSVGTISYSDLTNKPTIPTDVSDLTDTENLLGSSGTVSSLVNGLHTLSLNSDGVLTFPGAVTFVNNVFLNTQSDTITEEILGGTISQTNTQESRLEIDHRSITIGNATTQISDDGVVTTTDEMGSRLVVSGSGISLRHYADPDGLNNLFYHEVSANNSGAILQAVQENVADETYGRVLAAFGVVEISTRADGIEKSWGFNYDGTMVVPTNSTILGTNDLTIRTESDGNSGLYFNSSPIVGSAVLYATNNVVITADYDGNRRDWNFDKSGTITVPLLLPKTFTAVLNPAHYVGEGTLVLEGDAWEYTVAFQVEQNGTVQTTIDNIPWVSNPGYIDGLAFEFVEADHGIPGYTFTLTLTDVQNPGPMMYTANIAVNPPPEYPATVESLGAIKLTTTGSTFVPGPQIIASDAQGGITNDFISVWVEGGGTNYPEIVAVQPGWTVVGEGLNNVSVTDVELITQFPGSVIYRITTAISSAKMGYEYTFIGPDGSEPDLQNWVFGTDGNLHFPDGSFQGTAFVGLASSAQDLYKAGEIFIGIGDGVTTTQQWSFGTDGKLTAPGEVYGQYFTIRGGNGPGTEIGSLGYSGDVVTVFGYEGFNIETGAVEGGPRWQFGTDGVLIFPDNSTYANNTLTGTVDNDTAISTGQNITTDHLYANPTDFVSDLIPNGFDYVFPGLAQRNETQIEVDLFVPPAGDLQTFLTGLALGRTAIATYSTASGTGTITGPVSQEFTVIAQSEPTNGWYRVSGRIDGIVPEGYTGLISINFPVTNTVSHTWTFSTDGTTTFPGDSRLEAPAGNTIQLYTSTTDSDINAVQVNSKNIHIIAQNVDALSWAELLLDNANPAHPDASIHVKPGSGSDKIWGFNSEGTLTFPDSSAYANSRLTGATDGDLEFEVKHRTTVSAEAISGSSLDLLVVDISEDDDITVVGAGWEINAGSEIAPQWMAVVSTDIVPGDTCSINVPGFDFIAGFTYTFRNPVPESKVWTVRSQTGGITGPGGAIITNETYPLVNTETYSGMMGVAYTSGGLMYFDFSTPTLYVDSSRFTDSTLLAAIISAPVGTVFDFSLNSIPGGYTFTTDSLYSAGGFTGTTTVPGGQGAPAIDNISFSISSGSGTYRELAIELPTPDGQGDQRWVFSNDGNFTFTAPGDISAGFFEGQTLDITNAGAVSSTYAGELNTLHVKGNAGNGLTLSANGGLTSWLFKPDGSLTLPQYNQIGSVGSNAHISLNGVGSNESILELATNLDGEQITTTFEMNPNGVGLNSVRSIDIHAGYDGGTFKYDAWQAAEQDWTDNRNQDAITIAPDIRPWADMPSYEAYDEILLYTAPSGVLPQPDSLIVIASIAKAAYELWQAEQAAINVTVSATDRTWTFGANGTMTFPDSTVQTTAYTGNLASAIRLGYQAGSINQSSTDPVAVGNQAGRSNQGDYAVSVGANAGALNQGARAIAIGVLAGDNTQGAGAVAIGANAGNSNQGANAIAIGYHAGLGSQPANSIVLNATGSSLTGDAAGFHVAPVRNQNTNNNILTYDTTTKEVAYRTDIRVEGEWTVTAGTNNYSFTVPVNGTYTMWVRGNIPNGIIVWNATVTITNSNVPVVGQQFAWVYDGAGNPLDFTSIPSQIVGTAGTILRSYISSGTTNEFIFGIANTSGASQTVYYGYTKI